MQAAIRILNDLADRHRYWVLGAWIVVLVAAVPLSARQSDRLTSGGFVAPASSSAVVDRSLHEFPEAARLQQGVLLQLDRGHTKAALQQAASRTIKEVSAVRGVISAELLEPAVAARIEKSNLQLVTLALAGDQDSRVDVLSKLLTKLDIGKARDGVTSYLIGQGAVWAELHSVQKDQLSAAERIGFPVTLLILLVSFGAFAAATLPLVLGVVSVTLTGAVVYLISHFLTMSLFVTNAAAMLGIAVAIDYSFFILARYRQEVATGASLSAARLTALRTSGVAVIFSGLTVIVSLAGVFLSESTALRSMALGAIVVVAFSVVAAVGLLPAMIALLGPRLAKRGLPGRASSRLDRAIAVLRRDRADSDFWARWTRRVMARPVLCVVLASAAMLTMAVPALSLHIREGAINSIPKGNEARTGIALAAKIVGAGGTGPIEEMIQFPSPVSESANVAALESYVEAIKQLPQVASVDTAEISPRNPRRVLLTIVPRGGPESASAGALVQDLRNRSDFVGHGRLFVGGETALLEDFVALVENSMWKITVFVVIFSYLALMLMLRSIVLPLKAIFMTLLSVASAYGMLVVVFQWGWLDGLFGYHSPGYVDTLAPPLLLAVTFGLSMDYEIFMLVRIREATHTMDDRAAVAHGLRESAGTISSAALIMVSVFLAFAAVGAVSIKQIGVGEAVAIALDVTVVRLVLVPATMALLGRWNWWYPRQLERRLSGVMFDEKSAVEAVEVVE